MRHLIPRGSERRIYTVLDLAGIDDAGYPGTAPPPVPALLGWGMVAGAALLLRTARRSLSRR